MSLQERLLSEERSTWKYMADIDKITNDLIMNLEVGSTYITRDGKLNIKVDYISGDVKLNYPIKGSVVHSNDALYTKGEVVLYKRDGSWGDGFSGRDLTEKVSQEFVGSLFD